MVTTIHAILSWLIAVLVCFTTIRFIGGSQALPHVRSLGEINHRPIGAGSQNPMEAKYKQRSVP